MFKNHVQRTFALKKINPRGGKGEAQFSHKYSHSRQVNIGYCTTHIYKLLCIIKICSIALPRAVKSHLCFADIRELDTVTVVKFGFSEWCASSISTMCITICIPKHMSNCYIFNYIYSNKNTFHKNILKIQIY